MAFVSPHCDLERGVLSLEIGPKCNNGPVQLPHGREHIHYEVLGFLNV